MNEVYLGGRALLSSLGGDLQAAQHAVARGGVPAVPVALADGSRWPCQRIDDRALGEAPLSWRERSRRLVQQAARDSGALDGERRGVLFIASSSLDIGELENSLAFADDHQAFADTVAGWLDWRGPVHTVSTACTSGLNALLSARTLLRHGVCHDALVLGLELHNRVTLGGFGGMQLLSADRARPLGAERDGLVLGEAVAALRLTTQAARWRLAGGANVVDGRDPAGAIESAVVEMCTRALADSGLRPHQIGLYKLQAAGGPTSDATETRALQEVFGTLPPWVTFKALLGHTLGASGVAELALLTACLEGSAWPTPDYPLDPALGVTRAPTHPGAVRHVMASILGFGGGHTAVVLEDLEAPR